jgi:hypothetical protein
MRTKTIELDGAKWMIAPLTLRQVEEWIKKQKETLEMPEGAARDRELSKAWREFLAMGLNNVHRLEDGKFPEPRPPLVDPEEIPDRLDLLSFETLRDELMKFSRLAGVPGESPGEASAAS